MGSLAKLMEKAALQQGPDLVLTGLERLGRPVEIRWFPTWRALLPAAQERRPVAADGAAAASSMDEAL